MNTKQSVLNIIIGSVVLGLADTYLYMADKLSVFAAFAGYTVLSFVVMLFLISFLPARAKRQSHGAHGKQPHVSSNEHQKHKQPANVQGENGDKLAGRIKWYNPKKGFGFLIYGDQEIFFHRHSIRTRHHHFQEQDPILFYLGEGDKGPQATAIWYNKG